MMSTFPKESIAVWTSLSGVSPFVRSPANRAAVRGYDMTHTDRVPQRVLDRQLWQAVHGAGSKPPPPGPNAQPGRDDDG